jgi:hypothetical protein
MELTYNAAGEVVRRVVTGSDGWRITQVRQPDGSWWNIGIDRVGGSR